MPPPPPDQHWKIGFSRRLAYLLLGVAIGCVMLGVFQSMKRAALQQQQQQQQPQQGQPATPGDAPATPK